ncbi:MAG: glycosyltransferase family 4 protein [Actinomycetota bacterium]|nr:glycosyltransferase family 4 protein [Actinomycetota bacterium]
MPTRSLVVVESHPVQYHAPVYRALQQDFGIPVTAVYGSDFSVGGYFDREFGAGFAWDADLLSGYTPLFVRRVAQGGAKSVDEVRAEGLAGRLNRLKPDAVLLTGYGSAFNRGAIRALRKSALRVLFRGETTDHAAKRGWAKRAVRDAALGRLYRRCSGLLYIGQLSRAHYERLGCPAEKLVFSPYCVDTTPFSADENGRRTFRDITRKELGIDNGQIVVLFSGKLSPRKGPDLLVDAVRLLEEENQQRVVVAFLGSGEMEEGLKRQATAPPTADARFIGFRNQSRLSAYYHAADVLCLPSRHSETWGLAVNEALHHGLPCLVSDAVGCAPDLITPEKTGWICAAGRPDSLAQELRKAIGAAGGRQVRQRCREAVAGYTVERAAAGIAEAFESITTAAKSPPTRTER